MSTTVGGQVIPNARMTAIRAVFIAMFDAVDTINDWNEDRWIHLIAAFNETGRVVFGWPQLESSESDIFGALDTIAEELDAAKTAMQQTAKDTRIVLGQLHEALDPMLPDEPTEPEPDPPLLEEPVRVATNDSLGPRKRRQGPRYDVEAMFAVMRRHTKLSAAAEELGILHSALLGRLDTLEGHGELPDDIKAMRHRIHPAAPVKRRFVARPNAGSTIAMVTTPRSLLALALLATFVVQGASSGIPATSEVPVSPATAGSGFVLRASLVPGASHGVPNLSVPDVSAPDTAGSSGMPEAVVTPSGEVGTAIMAGNISWADPELGGDYLATRFPRGTLVEICATDTGICIVRRTNDFGPHAGIKPNRIADLAVLDWEQICRLDRERGLCPGTVEAIEDFRLPATDATP